MSTKKGAMMKVGAEPAQVERPRYFFVVCTKCPDVLRDDCIENHMQWVHRLTVKCRTCLDRGWVPNLWDSGDQECPARCDSKEMR